MLVVLESIREHKKFKVTTYKITNDKIPLNFKNTRIVVLSDMHNTFYGDNNEKVLKAVKNINPAFIILAGDMPVANTKNIEMNLKSARFVAKLSDIADVYYGMGNHEERMMEKEILKEAWKKYTEILDTYKGKYNIYYLNNDMIKIKKEKEAVNLYGLNLELKYYKRFSNEQPDKKEIDDRLGTSEKGSYNIMIAHNPDFFESYVAWGADLILSGHVHGGMVRLPLIGGMVSPKPRFFPHFDYGEYKKGNSIMLLSNGLGSHSIKLRINNIPEIILIEFDR